VGVGDQTITTVDCSSRNQFMGFVIPQS